MKLTLLPPQPHFGVSHHPPTYYQADNEMLVSIMTLENGCVSVSITSPKAVSDTEIGEAVSQLFPNRGYLVRRLAIKGGPNTKISVLVTK